MKLVTVARYYAVALGLGTVGYLFLAGMVRADNAFLIPDLIISGLLIMSAFLPPAYEVRGMILAYGMAAGVFTTAAFSALTRGDLGVVTVAAAAGSLVVAALLVTRQKAACAVH
ncbi:hypothetical protein ACQEVF_46320 [Nonomuraea polychroma]|uniref:hypothetical protein n=1 Tax=Nonomuraea polychroma TaxID=46176 RepID=UPI003D8F8F9E